MSLFKRLFSRQPDPRHQLAPLYAAVVARGREPHWYLDGKVPDTQDGRFDMIAAVLSIVLLRLEKDDLAQEGVWLTELFVDDMEAQLRQLGVGDVVVGKHIGRMMSALGGRLSAYRPALDKEDGLADALARNLYRGEPVEPAALAHVEQGLQALASAVAAQPAETLLSGKLPS